MHISHGQDKTVSCLVLSVSAAWNRHHWLTCSSRSNTQNGSCLLWTDKPNHIVSGRSYTENTRICDTKMHRGTAAATVVVTDGEIPQSAAVVLNDAEVYV